MVFKKIFLIGTILLILSCIACASAAENGNVVILSEVDVPDDSFHQFEINTVGGQCDFSEKGCTNDKENFKESYEEFHFIQSNDDVDDSIKKSPLTEDIISKQVSEDMLSATTTKSFSDLNKLINSNNNRNIYLNHDYTYNPKTDSKFKYGIKITKAVTIHGNGHTLNGNEKARIFFVKNEKVIFKNINFINGNVDYNDNNEINGGAIFGYSTCINCNFINNYAVNAGAMNEGVAKGCAFINNSAIYWGGAMYYGSVYNCRFIGNVACYGGALWYCFACNNCLFENNFASLWGGAVNTAPAINCRFINNNAMYGGAIYKGSSLNCVFENNSATWGGAAYKTKLNNCKFTDNNAELYGGAVFKGCAIKCIYKNNIAEKGGNNKYKVASKLATKIYKKSKIVKRGSKSTIAVIKDSTKYKIKKIRVYVKINGKTIKVKTNKKGEIKLSTKKLFKRSYTVQIKFKGNKYYKKSISKFNILIK